MSHEIQVRVPDIGDFDDVPVIEILVAEGEAVEPEQSLVTLESDKATMEVPAPTAGTVQSLAVALGDTVSEGDLIATLLADEVVAKPQEAAPEARPEPSQPEPSPPKHSAPPQSTPAATAPAAFPQGDFDFDLVVLGAGPGGYTAAFRAADLGLKVALIERYPTLGGVCLNVGCIPSKALLHAAAIIDEAEQISAHGVVFGPPDIQLDALRGWKNKVVGQLTGGLAGMSKQRGVTIIEGTGEFTGPNEIAVETADGRRAVSFSRAIIAAGSQSFKLPGLPWDDPRLMDSTGALELADIPDRLLVIGGGIIGLEMASVYAALGSRVTVVELTSQLMPGADKDLVRPLQKRMSARCEGIYLDTKVTSLTPAKTG